MKRQDFPFISFLIFLCLSVSFDEDFSTSLIPGWHATLTPPFFIAPIILFLVTLGYSILIRRKIKVNRVFFLMHLIATIPTILFIRIPYDYFILLGLQKSDDPMEVMMLVNKVIQWAYVLFIAGQLSFLVYFLRSMPKNGIR
jgi:hypothetical protein